MSLNGDDLTGALEALARGESIVATTIAKRPWFSWKKFQNERPTEQQLRAWAEDRRAAGLAVITGEISNLIVLDFDDEHGIALMKRLELDPHIKTGSGAFHVRMAHPGHYVPTQNSEVTKILQDRWHGLDIRADGGLAVQWGTNANGAYEQLRDLTDLVPISALPPELAVDLRLIETKNTSSNGTQTKKSKKVTHPGRYDHLFKIGCGMRGRGHEEAAILAELRRVNQAECEPPKTDEDVTALARDIATRYPRGGPAGDRAREDPAPELRERLTKALKIDTGGYRVSGTDLHGARGPSAICAIHTVDENGEISTIRIGRYGNLTHPATLSGLVAAYTGVGDTFTAKECATIAGLVTRLAAHERLIDEDEIVVDYGLAWLRDCTTLYHADPKKQSERWSAWVYLRDLDPITTAAKEKTSIAVNAAMVRDSDGWRYVHSGWFWEHVRRDHGGHLGAPELYSRMVHVGWERPRGRGRIKATKPDGTGEIQLPLFLVPPTWETEQ